MSPLSGDRERGGDVLVAPATPPGVSALAVVRLTGRPARRARSRAGSRRTSPPSRRRAGRSSCVSWTPTAARWTAASSSSGPRRTRRPARRSSSSSATARRASSRASWTPRGARARGRRSAASSRGARSRTASSTSRRPRGSRRSRGRRAAARRGARSGSWRARSRRASVPPRERTLDALAVARGGARLRRGRAAGGGVARGTRSSPRSREDLASLARAARGAGERRPVVAILGRPNAGKSTLFNALVGRDRAIVTATPGTTRDAISEAVEIAGESVTLLDTAGLREASEEVERIGVAVATRAGENADLVALCRWMRFVACPKRTKIFLEGEEGRARSS